MNEGQLQIPTGTFKVHQSLGGNETYSHFSQSYDVNWSGMRGFLPFSQNEYITNQSELLLPTLPESIVSLIPEIPELPELIPKPCRYSDEEILSNPLALEASLSHKAASYLDSRTSWDKNLQITK